MPNLNQETEEERLRRIRQEEYGKRLGVGVTKAIVGGLGAGAVPTAIGRTTEMIPTGVGRSYGIPPAAFPPPARRAGGVVRQREFISEPETELPYSNSPFYDVTQEGRNKYTLTPKAEIPATGGIYAGQLEEAKDKINRMVDELLTPQRTFTGKLAVTQANKNLVAELRKEQFGTFADLEQEILRGEYGLAGHRIVGKYGLTEQRIAGEYGLAGHRLTAKEMEARNAIDRERLAWEMSQTDMKKPENVAKILMQWSPKKRVNQIDPETQMVTGYEDVPDIYTGMMVLRSLGVPISDSVLRYFQKPEVNKANRLPIGTYER